MTVVQTFIKSYEFYRPRTTAVMDAIEKLPNPQEALAWRPGPGRAHIGWQLMHIAITEELFATERLAPGRPAKWTDIWPRFRGGSTPDDNVPSIPTIRQTLEQARQDLVETLSDYGDERLAEIPPALAARGLTVLNVLYLLGWHEAHHQGQAHITLNLYRQAHGLLD